MGGTRSYATSSTMIHLVLALTLGCSQAQPLGTQDVEFPSDVSLPKMLRGSARLCTTGILASSAVLDAHRA